MDRSSKQKINKETQVLNDALDEKDLIDIFRTFHPNAKYTFFSNRPQILGHKSILSKFKKTENESTEKYTCKLKAKESWSSNPYSRQNRS